MHYQQTISGSVSCSGTGVHTGDTSHIVLREAAPHTGILFEAHDGDHMMQIPAHVDQVQPSALCTSLGAQGVQVHTVEHVLASVYALGITNLVIEIHGEEVPMWDGSSQAWTHLLKPVVKPQPYKATTLRMLRTIRVGSSDAWCELSPCDSYELSYHLNFDHDLLHDQHVHVSLTPGSFEQDIHWARTFGFHKDLSHLRSQHKALGASLNNVCVFSDHGVLNPEGMRAPDEPCRHKILDAVGDLSLMGTRIQGHFTGHHSGHALNHELMRAVLSDPHAWEIV